MGVRPTARHVCEYRQNRQFIVLVLYNEPTTPENYTLSLHDALPISRASSPLSCRQPALSGPAGPDPSSASGSPPRSEEHTSELQSRFDLVCRLLLEKKKH